MYANLVVIGSHGDVLPFVALGSELRARGHEVTLATAEPYEGLVRRAGLGFESLTPTEKVNELIGHADLWKPMRGIYRLLGHAQRLLRPTYEFTVRRYVPGETLTVASSLAMGARIAQDSHGIPLATIHLAPFLIRSSFDVPRLPGLNLPSWLPLAVKRGVLAGVDRYALDPLCGPVNTFRSGVGLPPVRGIMNHWWNSPDRVIAMFPRWFAAAQPDWPAQAVQVDFPIVDRFGDTGALSPDLETFLASGPKPVAFTFGSAMIHAGELFQTSLQTCKALGLRGIFISSVPQAVPPELAGQIIQTSYAPFSQLLPRCAAFVHHGGVGTVSQAMAAGVPQFIVPLAFDHFDEAVRVERLGVGILVPRSAYKLARAKRSLGALLSSTPIKRACGDLATRFAGAGGIGPACDYVEGLRR